MSWVKAEPQPFEVSWADLCGFLTDVERTDKPKVVEELVERDGHKRKEMTSSLPGWVPARLGLQRDKHNRVARVAKNVLEVPCLVLDFDDLTVEQWEDARAKLSGLSHCYHSTFSHQPISGQLCYRVAIQLDRPVPGHQWKSFHAVAAEMFGGAHDDKCSDPSRFYFGPHCPMGATPDSGVEGGPALPVDLVLEEASKRSRVITHGSQPLAGSSTLTHAEIRACIPARARQVENENVRAGYEGLIAALDGRPFAAEGARDATLLAMSGILARAFPNHTAEAIVAPLERALDLDDPEPGWAPEALRKKLERDLEKVAQERVEATQGALAQAGLEQGYSFSQIDEWVKRLGLPSRDALARQLIINHGADYWVFYEGDYVHLGSKEKAENAIYARLAACAETLPVAIGELTPKGYVLKPLRVLYQQYGRHAIKVVKDLRLQQSRLDKDVFYFAICRRNAELVPRHSHGVQLWLEGWGSSALLDWLATAPRLDKPTAALILDGAKRTGKSQLAKALASIWGARPTPMSNLTSSFNDSLSRCPVVYAEETIPWEFRRDTGLLKELVTSDSQQLREKYQSNADLLGSLRLVIARNDHKLFEAGEVLTQGTVDALMDRLLYVDTGSTPAPFFETREIAEHILWLEQNRRVPESTRPGLWVTGVPSRLHHRMRAFTSKTSVSVCEWLLAFLDRPQFCGDTAVTQFRLDSQGLRVTPKLVYEKWESYCAKEVRQPTKAQIAEALGGIGVRDGIFCKVDLEVLAEYADSIFHPLCSVSELQSAIEAAGRSFAAKQQERTN